MTPTAAQLLIAARTVMTSDASVFVGRRYVTAAALAREAIETAVRERLTALGVHQRMPIRSQFLCLLGAAGQDLHARSTVAAAHQAWSRLSDACHATSYDLPPTREALSGWLDDAARFVV